VDASESRRADAEVFDGVVALLAELISAADAVARAHGVPMFFLKAVHLLEEPMAMKDLRRPCTAIRRPSP